jgi:outer membrane protein
MVGALAASQAASADAPVAGDWLVRAGPYAVAPKSNNSDVANVDDGYSLGFTGTYMATDNIGIELLASLPFSHDIKLRADGSKVGETKHLPPTLSAQYYLPVSDTVRIYGGLGLNWTLFFDESTTGALEGTDLSLDDSLGLALQLGADFDVGDNWFFNVDVRYIDIETDAELDGDALATVNIDPWVYGINVGWRFPGR